MSPYRHQLPQLNGHSLLTDGGLETTLVFHEQLDLPAFAAYPLLASEEGQQRLDKYLQNYLDIARRYNQGFVLETPTWRTNPDWSEQLGHSPEQMDCFNRLAVDFMEQYRQRHDSPETPYVISGCIGPRHDAYSPETIMSVEEAQDYHSRQIAQFAESSADLVSALTISNIPEAIGIVLAAQQLEMPVVISFTVETDGCLPTGESLEVAISEVDRATNAGPAYYMINCAHPNHFRQQLHSSVCRERIRGLRANASKCSHAELDEAEQLDEGNPHELGADYQQLAGLLPELRVMGGCCGTDHRHVEEICRQHQQHAQAS